MRGEVEGGGGRSPHGKGLICTQAHTSSLLPLSQARMRTWPLPTSCSTRPHSACSQGSSGSELCTLCVEGVGVGAAVIVH